jgi:hypothetical protein
LHLNNINEFITNISLSLSNDTFFAEREEILTNIRNRISNLDIEITRLGGLPIENASHSIGIVVPSIAPFPSVKKPRGRPRKSDSETEVVPSKLLSSSEKKGGGNDRSPKEKAAKKDEPMSPLTSIAMSLISLKTGDLDPNVATATAAAAFAQNDAKTSEEPQDGDCGDWTCHHCGKILDSSKSRCGTCRRWKGGKRGKKWTIKGKEGEDDSNKTAKSSGRKKMGRPFKKTVKEIYAKLKLSKVDLGLKPENRVIGDVKPEVESVVSLMLDAVSEHGTKKKRRRSSDDNHTGGEQGKKKRKPGRPSMKSIEQERKNSVVTVEDNAKQVKKEEAIKEHAAPAQFAFESIVHVVEHLNNQSNDKVFIC